MSKVSGVKLVFYNIIWRMWKKQREIRTSDLIKVKVVPLFNAKE